MKKFYIITRGKAAAVAKAERAKKLDFVQGATIYATVHNRYKAMIYSENEYTEEQLQLLKNI